MAPNWVARQGRKRNLRCACLPDDALEPVVGKSLTVRMVDSNATALQRCFWWCDRPLEENSCAAVGDEAAIQYRG